jgi:hypothetical protein
MYICALKFDLFQLVTSKLFVISIFRDIVGTVMRMYVHVYLCMYIYIHMYTYICMCAYVCLYIHACKYFYVCMIHE